MVRYVSIVALLLLVVIVHLGHYFGILDPRFVPPINDIWGSYLIMLKDGTLWTGFIYSFLRITAATCIAVSISLCLSMAIVLWSPVRFVVEPLTASFRFIPVTAMYPILILWTGIGETMKVTFISIALLFYFLPTILLQLQEVERNLVETALTLGASRFELVSKVIMPYMLPSMLATLGMMYGIGWTYVIIAEIVNAEYGLGHIMNLASNRGRLDVVFATLGVIIVFSFLFDTTWKLILRKVFPWSYAVKGRS